MLRTFKNTLNVVAISQASKLLLTSCVPHIVPDTSSVGVETQWVHLNSQGGWDCTQKQDMNGEKNIGRKTGNSQFIVIWIRNYFYLAIYKERLPHHAPHFLHNCVFHSYFVISTTHTGVFMSCTVFHCILHCEGWAPIISLYPVKWQSSTLWQQIDFVRHKH